MTKRINVQGVTIDDWSTWDIDDAIWVEEVPGGGFKATISIADVSKVVTPGSQLDAMARERLGTQYFRSGNSPMLPRILAERRLSLWPHTPKKAMTVVITVNDRLERTSVELVRSTLQSHAKMNYSQVPTVLGNAADSLHPMLVSAKKLADGLLMKRRANGAMVLYDLNNGWVAVEEGYIRKLRDRADTVGYIIIQELMILANVAVADYAVKAGIPILFRTHEGRSEGPDREALLKQIEEAVHTPFADLAFLRMKTHTLLEKAKYEGHARGHYGLNVPVYTHFTSPIRRYADLVVHQQLRAYLKGEPLPYTLEQLVETGVYITTKAAETMQARSDDMKLRAENKAHDMVETRRLDGLLPKEFERATRVQIRSGEDASPIYTEVFLKRLQGDSVPLAAQTNVIVNAGETENWMSIKAAIINRLGYKPEDAVSILTVATQAYAWPALVVDSKQEGPSHAPIFTAVASLNFDAPLTIPPVQAGNAKVVRQMAAVNILAHLVGVSPPAFTKSNPNPVVPKAPSKPTFDFNKNPVSALMEWCQKMKHPAPIYDFKQEGPPHMPMITCTVQAGGLTREGKASSKQDAKALASTAVIGALSKMV